MVKIFTYGTLKKGNHNNPILKGSKYLGTATLKDFGIFDTIYGFPAVKPNKGSIVIGEVYEVAKITLLVLDWLEGYTEGKEEQNMYNRRIAEVTMEDNTKESVYFYEWRIPKKSYEEFIESGVWRKIDRYV